MNVTSVTIQADQDRQFRIYPIGDPHLDDRGCQHDKLRRYIDHIASDPHSFFIMIGDTLNGTVPSHFFFSIAETSPEFLLEMDDYIHFAAEVTERVFAPLRGRPGLWMTGNHGLRKHGTQWTGFDKMMAKRLEVTYGGYECLTRLCVKEPKGKNKKRGATVYKISSHHGVGGGRLPGSKVWTIERDAPSIAPAADFHIRGHVHDSFFRVTEGLDVTVKGEPRLIRRPVTYIVAPAFLSARVQGFSGYASQKAYRPTDTRIKYADVQMRDYRNGEYGEVREVQF